MKILNINKNYQGILKKTAKVILTGGLVIFPSDTVYILAVDPMNEKGVKKLLEFKNRWVGKAISVAVSDTKMAKEYVKINDNGKSIYANLLPGPFTVVSEGKNKMVKGIQAENGTLGIRIPDNKYILDLVKILKRPVTATSANLSGRRPNYSITSFMRPLSKKKIEMIDLIVDAGKLPRNKPSTVIDATESEIKILRRGDLITKNSKSLISKSEKETGKIAEFLFNKIVGKKNNKAVIFSLSGELGCGKTVFSRKIGNILGIKEKITSPTFVIYNEYKLKNGKFLHFDLYRIRSERDLKEIDFLKMFSKNTISCIEWPENMGEKNLKKIKKEVEWMTVNFKYLSEKSREIKYQL